MRKIAIKGDKTRGSEVLALLKMLGGENNNKCGGDCSYNYYHLTPQYSITSNELPYDENIYKLYTLDEFWKEFPHKVGDKVHILHKDKDAEVMGANWDSNTECVHYHCLYDRIYNITARAEDLAPITKIKADEPINIAKILKDAPKGTNLYSPLYGEVILDCVNIDVIFKPIKLHTPRGECLSLTEYGRYTDNEEYVDAECILFPSKENRDWSTFKVEPEFPTTYRKCNLFYNRNEIKELNNKIEALKCLIVCRDVWWKVDNDWKPDWNDVEFLGYVITNYKNKICNDIDCAYNRILVFRTEEIRDKFFDTFRDLIEQCKELI